MSLLMAFMKKKIHKLTLWDFSIVKIALILLGMILGAYLATFVKQYVWYFIIVFAVLYAYLIYKVLVKK